MTAQQEIEVLIRARYPILYVVTWEEERALATIEDVAQRLNRPVRTWSLTQGMKPSPSEKHGGALENARLSPALHALTQVHGEASPTVFVFRDFHPYIVDNRVIRLLRDLAAKLKARSQTLIITAPTLRLPMELEKEVTVVEFPLPTAEEITEVVDLALQAASQNAALEHELDPVRRKEIVASCQGLTLDEVEAVLARSLVERKKLDVEIILEQKKQIVKKSGVLEYYPATESFTNVGGMEHLKEWLQKRSRSLSDEARAFGLPAPKGVLLLGVQGCGKSLIAKAIASHWKLPMLRMDVGRIFGSLVGQSEENIRKAIRVAESIAPCVLWADELEKGFSGSQSSGISDGGTTARVFATFLTWLQEKTQPVFFIATANDVTQLPPELLRKGRFDEVFFIDLPDSKEREEIFAIHLKKRKRDPSTFNLADLAELTKGFSGAEIEQAVIGGMFLAFDRGHDLQQEDLVHEIRAVVPLSVMMREEIDELRQWARLRARPASRDDESPSSAPVPAKPSPPTAAS